MTKDQILEYIKQNPSSKVKLAVTDIDGILRGKYISTDKFLGAINGELSFCDVVFGWDSSDLAYDNVKVTGWHTGYPDASIQLDLSTFRKIPWERDIPMLLADFIDKNNKPAFFCPRQLLKKVNFQAEKEGYKAYFSQEFEWFNFRETSHSINEKGFRNMTPLTPGMFGYSILRTTLENPFFNDLFELLKDFGVPIEGLHTETGPGVLEAAITYSDIMEAGDRAVLFKTAVKEIAYKHGIIATFMAKWNETLPGCGGHVHQSIWDKDSKKNLFFFEKGSHNMSELMKSYIAGQLYCLPHILPMYAPNINSFKRLVPGAWAPTTLTWAVDNRTVALRALPGSNKSTRLETRVIGSDSNPYLAMAACLASGLYGVRNKLKLQDATTGNGYLDFSHGTLPKNLYEATIKMKDSEIAKELFGGEFVEHYCLTRDWEWRQHAKAVTDWELKRYFEII